MPHYIVWQQIDIKILMLYEVWKQSFYLVNTFSSFANLWPTSYSFKLFTLRATHNLYQLVCSHQQTFSDEIDLEDTSEQLNRVSISKI